jgi:hypothetical protein
MAPEIPIVPLNRADFHSRSVDLRCSVDLQAQTLAFHVHVVPAHHNEQEHRHGPAIHHHDHHGSSDPAPAFTANTVDDVVTIAVPAATPFSVLLADAEFSGAFSMHVPQTSALVSAIDVRSHGPPPARNSLLRGPPSSTHL